MTDNIMVTGHKGFVGKNVYDYLKKQGFNVHGFDLPENDFTSEVDVENSIKFHKINTIIHIGAVAGLDVCLNDPVKAIKANIYGTSILLKYALKYECKFLHTSTWAVNGHLKHPYDITKKMSEDLVKMYNEIYGLNTVIFRLATMYGKGMRAEGVIYNFIKKGLDAQSLIIQGDGKQYRQFLYIDDVNEAYECALKNWHYGELYEVQGDQVVTILDIARHVYPNSENIEFVKSRSLDEKPFTIDNRHTKEDLKWIPRISLSEGMTKLKKWIEKL